MNVQSVHHSLQHTLTDGDTTAELHMHDAMVCMASPYTQLTVLNIVFILPATSI